MTFPPISWPNVTGLGGGDTLMETLHPKVCLLFCWLKNSLYQHCQSHLSHGLRHSDRISSTIHHRATLCSGGNTTRASWVPGSLVGPRGLQGTFVQAMATLGPPLRTGTPETPLLSLGPCLSLCPILSPWTLPARLTWWRSARPLQLWLPHCITAWFSNGS